MSYNEDELLPLSGLEHLVYCERQAALIHVEGLWSDNMLTALGHDRHVVIHEPSVEVRGNVRLVRGLRLRSLELGLVGMADVIEFHLMQEDPLGNCSSRLASLPGAAGLWRPFPIEYKKGTMRKEPGYEVQICGQAICLEEMLEADVREGAIFFGESSRRWSVTFDQDLRKKTYDAAARFHELLSAQETPPPFWSKKCPNCSMVDICLPKAGRKGSVHKYLGASLEESLRDEEAS